MSKWRIGDVTVTKVVELEVTGGSRFLLPAGDAGLIKPIAWLQPHFADENGRLRMSIHSFIVETPTRRIIVDTCLGNDKQNRRIPHWNDRQGPFLADLADAGFPPESIDTVLCTHLHVDHVGWNTMMRDGKWVPTFPQARYLIGRIEYEHWRDNTARPDMQPILADSVTPILDAGLAQLVEDRSPHLRRDQPDPTIGHTPGHVSVRIVSRGEEALITGDFMHHPCQIAHPEWDTTADSDPAQGIRTRREMFERLAGTPVLVIGTHFAGATAGHIVRDELPVGGDVSPGLLHGLAAANSPTVMAGLDPAIGTGRVPREMTGSIPANTTGNHAQDRPTWAITCAAASSWHHSMPWGKPDTRAGTRHGVAPAPRQAELSRGLDRRAPLRRFRNHRLAGGVHRRRRRTDEAHQARHRRRVAALPQSFHSGGSRGAARPHDTRPGHVGRRARRVGA